MKTSKCRKCSTAKVSVTATNGETYSLTLFNDVISKIVGDGHDLEQPNRALLAAPKMKFYVDAITLYILPRNSNCFNVV